MKNLMSKLPWLLLTMTMLTACGEGGDDVKVNYDPETVISENASNEYVEQERAPEEFKVIYYVDAGDGTPGKIEALESFGTRSSLEDQAFGPDLVTGYSWGYTDEAAQYYADADNYGSIRGDERDTPGLGVEYAFEVDNGTYTVVIGFDDPWDAEGTRHVDIVIDGNTLSEGFYIPADAQYERFDDIEITDGLLELSVQRTATNTDGSADPQISWIEIWGLSDEEVAEPVQRVWISGEFQINDWELSQAPQMDALAEGWYETVVHFQSAGTYKFVDQNSNWNEYYGTDSNGNIVYSSNGGSMAVDAAGYYTIRFNIETLQYSATVKDLSAITSQDKMYIWGAGFPGYPDHDWNDESTSYYDIADAIPLVKNFNDMGEHVFGIEDLEFADVVQLQFVNSTDDTVAIQWGFSNLDVLNSNAGEFYWHKTVQQDWQYLEYYDAAGLYTVIFDYAVGRATLIKQTTGIYMVGAGTYADWDVSQAVEMTASEDYPGWYYVEIQFTNEYNEDPDKPPYGDYKFVSARNWDKDDYGLVDASTSDSGLVTEGESLDVMVNGGGDAIPAPPPGYYEVWFAPESLSYVLYEIDTSSTNVRTEMYIVGKGFVDYPDLDWSPENAISMTSNFNGLGDFVFGYECLQLSDAVDIKFLGQQAWADSESATDLDAGFVVGGEQNAPIIWAQAHVGDGSSDLKLVNQAGFYDVSFDYLANRINVVANNSCSATPSMWITGTFQYNDWDLSQAPQMEAQDDNWYEATVHFQDAGTYSFIATNTTWDDGWYGTDENGDIILTSNWGEGETPVDAAGYYTIRFNNDTLEYSATETDLSGIVAQDTMYIWGAGFPGYPALDWNDGDSTSFYDIADAIPLVKNFNGMGEHVFGIADLEFSDYVELQFVNSTDDSVAMHWGFTGLDGLNTNASDFYWHKTTQSDWQYINYSDAAGLYTLIFDYAAGRATLIKQVND